MKLYIMRHCAAVPGTRGDAGRGLTDQGRAQAAEMAGWLVQQVGTVGCIVTSTFARATETANIVGDILGCPHRPQTSFLDPEANPEQALDAITASANGYEDALVVTHAPLIGHLIEQASGARIDDDCFPHGSICHVERNELRWLVTLPLVERDREAFMDEAAEICDCAADIIDALREGWVTINGAHVFIGDDGLIAKGPAHLIGTKPEGEISKPSKADLAKLVHRGGKFADQTVAEETEKELAAGLGVAKSGNNSPFDLTTKTVGIEVKTKTVGSNDEISINKEAFGRKAAYAADKKLKRTFLLVVDKRPAGVGSSTGETRYFVRSDYKGGTNRLTSMKQLADLAAVKRYMKL